MMNIGQVYVSPRQMGLFPGFWSDEDSMWRSDRDVDMDSFQRVGLMNNAMITMNGASLSNTKLSGRNSSHCFGLP